MDLEQQLKILPDGRDGQRIHCVLIRKGNQSRKMLVDVRPNKAIWVMPEPKLEDMYTSWRKLKGDKFTDVGAIIVWAARDKLFTALYRDAFAQEPILSIEL